MKILSDLNEKMQWCVKTWKNRNVFFYSSPYPISLCTKLYTERRLFIFFSCVNINLHTIIHSYYDASVGHLSANYAYINLHSFTPNAWDQPTFPPIVNLICYVIFWMQHTFRTWEWYFKYYFYLEISSALNKEVLYWFILSNLSFPNAYF